ncbi:MAG: glycoside hydrolase family 95 protein [Pyrinomonadaceae bacterium]|nr:glycoside hydrolase family 95 protein [Pyrinomonadaceae bacterium]
MLTKHRALTTTTELLVCAVFCCSVVTASNNAADLLLWFDSPAAQFTQSLPLGNGRLGAMVFGGVAEERIILNESSLWSGSPQDADRPDAAKYLPEIRRLLLEGKNAEAEKLVYEHFTCQGPGSARARGKDAQYGSYQTLANLRINFPAGENGVSRYRRELDLENAIARVQYEQNGVLYSRETFVSAPDQVVVVRLSASKPASINFDASLDRPERFSVSGEGGNSLLMTGQLNNGTDGKGMKHAARLRAFNKGGEVSLDGNSLLVKNANEVVLLVTAATDYIGFAGRRTPDPVAASAVDLSKSATKTFATLVAAHVKDYQHYFNRVSLQLGPANSDVSSKPMPARLQAFAQGTKDPGLAALYFQYGRYLLISSSRPGGLPANLQGIWAEEVQTPWNADWHLNVNVQMNYWPAEVANLTELHQPLFALIDSLQVPGARTAKLYYNARGWVAHVITNPWGFTAPGEGASWGSTTSGSAWLCQHLWDHYLFTRDKAFLKWAYPIMKGSARFYADMLIEEPKHKWLVTAPANSPENGFRLPDGKVAHVVMGPAIDMQLLRYLFEACIESSRILGVDADFRQELTEKKSRLAPTRVGSDGRVMEWLEEYEEAEPTHRHVSHLWGLYPGSEITLRLTPQLSAAARKTLEARGDISTGWSLAYKMNLWARLGDGNRAHLLLSMLLSPVGSRAKEGVTFAGGSYENLFDAHPPFQIDGNFGATAGVGEVLIQSGDGVVQLLPALPDAWSEGKVTGLRARGGFELDMAWKDGKLTAAMLRSKSGGACRVRYGEKILPLDTRSGGSYAIGKRLSDR